MKAAISHFFSMVAFYILLAFASVGFLGLVVSFIWYLWTGASAGDLDFIRGG
jgi:hypothetical protein